eukprot:TRINITY_DN7706_c0_g1_i3.p1 TRINITY_DN7706_c0_g1~~TRINITY_DN7706_c0_g1_i3.p1  ORF type:complete len:394 (-),score=33.99 TRINITY_DN7706_c0_g1_i3:289-1470(-)
MNTASQLYQIVDMITMADSKMNPVLLPQCKQHPTLEVSIICLDKHCQSRLLCSHCVVAHHKQFPYANLTTVEDFIENRFLTMRRAPKIEKAAAEFKENSYKALHEAEKELDHLVDLFSQAIDDIKQNLQRITEQEHEAYMKSMQSLIKSLQETVQEFNFSNYDLLLTRTNEEIAKSFDANNQVQRDSMQKYDILNNIFRNSLFWPGLYSFCADTSEYIMKMAEEFPSEFRRDYYDKVNWSFDPHKKSSHVELLENNMVAAPKDTDGGSVVGKLNLKGKIVQWKLTVLSLEGFLVFGVAEGLPRSYSQYSHTEIPVWWIGSDGKSGRVLEREERSGIKFGEGDVVDFTFNGNIGTLRIRLKELEYRADGLNVKSDYYLYVSMIKGGGRVALSLE